ncbi:MAG: hypothetical protein QXH37_01405 [Candidatus Bathyarchaeia archaeon]
MEALLRAKWDEIRSSKVLARAASIVKAILKSLAKPKGALVEENIETVGEEVGEKPIDVWNFVGTDSSSLMNLFHKAKEAFNGLGRSIRQRQSLTKDEWSILKVLENTFKKGLIKRELLEAIKGRSRKRQLILAKEFKFSFIPSPAGGCLLTDLNFGKRLKELKDVFPDFKGDDIELLKLGRHFWEDKVKIVVGRNKEENFLIEKLTKKGDILVKIKNYPSPTTLIRSYNKKIEKEVIDKAKFLTVYYSNKAKNKKDIEFLLLKK